MATRLANEAADHADADASPENQDLKCGGKAGGYVGTDYIEQVVVTDGAADTNPTRTRTHNRNLNRNRTKLGGEWKRTWRWLGWGWIGDARATLRGRRLFTLFAVVNLVNYLDRGVRVALV